MFPIISESCLRSVEGRLLAEAWCRGRSETRPYMLGIRLGCWRPWGLILFFAGITGHFQALGGFLREAAGGPFSRRPAQVIDRN